VIAWLESMTRLDSSHDFWSLVLDSNHIEKNDDSTRLESCFSQNDSTRVTVNDSRLESESFLQNLWVPDGQTQCVCTQTNEDFLLQWWSRLGEIFRFDCLVVLCCILRIKCPKLRRGADLRLYFHGGVSRGTIYWHLWWFNVVFE